MSDGLALHRVSGAHPAPAPDLPRPPRSRAPAHMPPSAPIDSASSSSLIPPSSPTRGAALPAARLPSPRRAASSPAVPTLRWPLCTAARRPAPLVVTYIERAHSCPGPPVLAALKSELVNVPKFCLPFVVFADGLKPRRRVPVPAFTAIEPQRGAAGGGEGDGEALGEGLGRPGLRRARTGMHPLRAEELGRERHDYDTVFC